MFSKIKDFFFGDYDRKTILSSSGSFLISIAFAVYNGYLGIRHGSLWHGSICVYYILISVSRAVLIISDLRIGSYDRNTGRWKQITLFILTHILLLIMNLSLIVPISLMVRMQKPVDMTLIPAIAMAAYTTYKVTMASINLKKRKKSSNRLVRLLRTISFIDALVSILTLQNTLIMVNTKNGGAGMLTLSAITGAVIMITVLAISVGEIIKGVSDIKKAYRT